MFRHTFEVKEWRATKFTKIIKNFDHVLSLYEVREQLGKLFDNDQYKWVSFKKIEEINESGKVLRKVIVSYDKH